MNEPHFLIIATGWNCQRYARGCVESVKAQTYKNFKVVYVDDGSTDGTADELAKANGYCFSYGRNYGTVFCRDVVIKREPNENVIIVWLDLDDELLPNALERLAVEYQNPDCWLTYGNYIDTYGRVFFDSETIHMDWAKPVRENDWKFIHLRSFRKQLYDHLSLADVFPEKREVYPDANMLYCLLELAGSEHTFPIADVLYKYNDNNPLSVTRRFPDAVRDEEINFIKSLQPKQQLTRL